MSDAAGGPVHVALAFDDNFWAPAYATMRSVCLSTHRRAELVFHLVHSGLSDAHVADLERIADEFGAALRYYDPSAVEQFGQLAASLPHTRYISSIMYARLFLDRLVDPSIGRLVYLDCDVLVRAPIEQLAGADLEGRPVGAVADPTAWRLSNGRDVASRYDLHDPADPYFNSGVLVLDLDAWRRLDLAKVLRDLEDAGILSRLVNDQDVLNYLFKRNWTRLDGLWNAIARGRSTEVLDPKIVHYTGLNKPWNLVSGLPYARVYRHVMTNELFHRYLRYRWWRRWLGRQRLR